MDLISEWFRGRSDYVSVNNKGSIERVVRAGTVQGSVLGPILYAIFVSPLFDLLDATSFADDSYIFTQNADKQSVISELERLGTLLINWFKASGLKVNENKTEVCIFHKNDIRCETITLGDTCIKSSKSMKILGVLFDQKLKWNFHIEEVIKQCKKRMQALRLIRRFFTAEEMLQAVNGLFYSKMYYSACVWLIPYVIKRCLKRLYSMSGNMLRIVAQDYDRVFSFKDLHVMFKRAPPTMWSEYCHLLQLYNVMNNNAPEDLWLGLQQILVISERTLKMNINSHPESRVGLNCFLLRISQALSKINVNHFNLQLGSFKSKIKHILKF